MKNSTASARPIIYYVCFYSDATLADQIVSYPSVWSKIDYLISVFKRSGFSVEVVSEAESIKGRFKGFKRQIDAHEANIYFSSTKRNSLFMRKLTNVIQWVKIITYLLCHAKKNDIVFVYHSIYNLKWLWVYNKIFRKKYILEIEDVFSALSVAAQKFYQKELNVFNSADACICVNDLLAKKFKEQKTTLVSYGSYALPPCYPKTSSDKIQLVYAGVIEQERNAAFLAARSMIFLPDQYELNILGFGEKKDIDDLEKLIRQINEQKKYPCIVYQGRKAGEEYSRFLQNCDIGLSTHMYDKKNMQSADNTFPSKVLVYLAHNLRVVAQRLECLESSCLNFGISYYDEATPQELAETILKIDLNQPFNSREKIKDLDIQFLRDMTSLLKSRHD